MISFDFDYYRPDSVSEAVAVFEDLHAQQKEPLYYGGGTEIITMARANRIFTKGVIDLKNIPACNVLEFRGNQLVIGAGVTLSRITESKLFPLLGKSCGRIADHTVQDKLTLGGNLAGTIIYREAVLPLLLADCQAVVADQSGERQVPFRQIFRERLQLDKGAFLVQVMVEKGNLDLPYVHVKKTKNEKIDYPLISLAAVKKDGKVRLGLSGVCGFPFRSAQLEEALNNGSESVENRVNRALACLPGPLLDNVVGSAQFRAYVLKETLVNTVHRLEEVEIC